MEPSRLCPANDLAKFEIPIFWIISSLLPVRWRLLSTTMNEAFNGLFGPEDRSVLFIIFTELIKILERPHPGRSPGITYSDQVQPTNVLRESRKLLHHLFKKKEEEHILHP